MKLHAAGFEHGGRYRVAMLSIDKKRYPTDGFVGTNTREINCNLNSSMLRKRASNFEIHDDQSQIIITSAFS